MKLLILSLFCGFIIACGLLVVPTVSADDLQKAGDLLKISSGVAEVGIDRHRGGAITWLKWNAYPQSVVNIADPGRLIQQSYYAGKAVDRTDQGQSKSWSPWSWNPIQGGGIGSWARVVDSKLADDALFCETVPKLWDMPNEEAQARMRQWTAFEPGMPNVIVVKNEIVCSRELNDIWGPAIPSPQEVPACYFTRNFQLVKSYLGQGTWRPEHQPAGPPWGRAKPPLNAMACFEKDGQGIAVFSPSATQHWNFGPHGGHLSADPKAGPCMHLAPIDRVVLGPRSTYRYRYWMIVGDAADIAGRLDTLIERYSNERAESFETPNDVERQIAD